MYQQSHNPETHLFDRLGDALTGGGWSLMKWIFIVFVKVNALLLMVFLRKNMGGKMINFSVYFFGMLWFLIAFAIATGNWHYLTTNNATQGHRFSGGLLWYHAQAFYYLLIYRGIAAWINLRRSGQKGVTIRHSYSIGESVVYPVIRRILLPLGLIDDEANPRSFWKITEDRWIQLWEPLIIILVGCVISNFGYSAYGNFLILSGMSLGLFTFQAYNNAARIRQAQTDAGVIQTMLPGGQDDNDMPKHIIGKD